MAPHDASKPFPATYIDEINCICRPDGGFYTPYLLKDLWKNPDMLENLMKLQFVGYAGAPLDQWVGDLLTSQGVTVQAGISSVEMGTLPLIEPGGENWNCYHFHPACGIRMDLAEDNGTDQDLYELVIDKDPNLAIHQTIFNIYPEKHIFRSNDLYARHPDAEKQNAWLYAGRADNFVKLSWLQTLHAKDVENAISDCSAVKAVMIACDTRPEPWLLIELHERNERVKDEVWRAVEEVNESLAADVRVSKELVLFASVDRPFGWLGKGGLDRMKILSTYWSVIESMYEQYGKRKID